MIWLIIAAVVLMLLLGFAVLAWSLAHASRDDDAPGPFDTEEEGKQ